MVLSLGFEICLELGIWGLELPQRLALRWVEHFGDA
jgi:hypothetical protein